MCVWSFDLFRLLLQVNSYESIAFCIVLQKPDNLINIGGQIRIFVLYELIFVYLVSILFVLLTKDFSIEYLFNCLIIVEVDFFGLGDRLDEMDCFLFVFDD